MIEPFSYIVLGLCSGFLGGLLGIGGGGIIVPVLIYMLPLAGVDGPNLAKIAIATSLAVVMPTAVSSSRAHLARHAVEWRALLALAPGVVLGALGGAAIAANVSGVMVVLVFVMFLLFSAWRLAGFTHASRNTAMTPLPGAANLAAKGAGIGVLSALVGVGGGALSVPLLSGHMSMQRAVGTGAALGVPISVAGVAGYLLLTTPADCSANCVGYVYWPAALLTAVPAVLMAPVGARLAHVLPVLALKRAFAVLLLLVSLNLAYKALPLSEWLHAGAAWVSTDAAPH